MIHLANTLQKIVDGAVPRLRAIPESRVSRDRGAGKWTGKEILGHLIDSAANNQQRFVRAREENPLTFPPTNRTSGSTRMATGRARGWNSSSSGARIMRKLRR